MFNHSCSPNAAWEIDSSGCLRVVTTAEVPAGDELRITYTDPRQPAATRRARLRRHFFFDCDCDLCLAGAAPWVCALCGHDNARGEPRCGGGSSSTAAGSAAAGSSGSGSVTAHLNCSGGDGRSVSASQQRDAHEKIPWRSLLDNQPEADVLSDREVERGCESGAARVPRAVGGAHRKIDRMARGAGAGLSPPMPPRGSAAHCGRCLNERAAPTIARCCGRS
mmetsp:Transcript_41543/g.134199  ORF Transcript_41543/g.134199 Transcript_41543/m.134199 type:complete len:222 (+) Transcript_41543:139-804(+)